MALADLAAVAPWAHPEITGIGRLPMHTPIARDDRVSLDGDWAFALYDHPDLVPDSAINGAIDGPLPEQRLTVPGNWTLQIDDDLPHYTNVQMPYDDPPPQLPTRAPTGVFRRTFQWRRDGVAVLHVGGAESVHAVYVNARFVGYGTDSRLPSEYDISDVVVDGDNEIAIVVVRYSSQSFVEDQDQWWMAGLHRSVWVERRPALHIADIRVRGDYDAASATGIVDVAVDTNLPATASVRFELVDPAGDVVGTSEPLDVPANGQRNYHFVGPTVHQRWELTNAAAWSAESPQLYAVRATLHDSDGAPIDEATTRVGLRRVEVRDRQLLVNGEPIWIFGVNRHDHHPDRGKALTVDDYRADLVAMKRANISAIRTSHYPNASEFYDLCDELGFYVVDEANIESHAYNTSLCHDPRYRSTWVERGARMVSRDFNHPSVIMWSLGNESGYGSNHDALAGWIRRVDPYRPLHYEGAIFHGDDDYPGIIASAGRVNHDDHDRGDQVNPSWVDSGFAATDVVCPMYAAPAAIGAYGADTTTTRPLILCEYSHAMGNSNGSLADYWDTITSTPGLQGGFIWEWKDHGLRQRASDGVLRLAYGGDFDDKPNDGNFVADGLVSADVVPHPAMDEVAWCYRPVVADFNDNTLTVTNRRHFTSTEDLAGNWQLLVNGEPQASGSIEPLEPGSSTTIDLGAELERLAPEHQAHGEIVVNVVWTLLDDTWFAPQGHVVARDSHIARPSEWVRPEHTSQPFVPEVADTVVLWRPPTDNDGFKLMPELFERLRVGGRVYWSWVEHGLTTTDNGPLVDHRCERVPTDDGAERVTHTFTVPADIGPVGRVGVRFAIPRRFTRQRYYGRGPGENYPDRSRGSALAIWEHDHDALPYLVPQEYGLRTDCRFVELIDPDAGEVIRIDAVSAPFHMSVRGYSDEALLAAAHDVELSPDEVWWVHLDATHRGVGTASCGPDTLDQYTIAPGTYTLDYVIGTATGASPA